MGLLRVSVDHLVRISAKSARVHTRVRGSSIATTGTAARKAAEVRELIGALGSRGIAEEAVEITGIANASDSWSMPQPRGELADSAMMYASSASQSAPLDLGVELNSTTELSTHLSVDFELSS